MAKPTDWLGGLIERELQAVVSWRNSTEDIYDGESRFEDDGSNLRSDMQDSSLPPEPVVQITRIVSNRTPVIAVITDGYTQVKAKLLDDAIATLESEIGEKLGLETKGDFIFIKEATVASTPYGPKDEHVQLEIHDIEYKYHLRKSLGPAQPIHQRSGVAKLLNEITELRNRQHDAFESYAKPESTGASAITTDAAAATAGASRDGHRKLTNESHRPQSQAALSQIGSSPPSLTQQSYNTPNAIATQFSNRRKRKAPSLAEDGLEILQGNNLARPHGPGWSVPTTRPFPSKRRQSQDGRNLLLGLLNSNPQGPGAQRETPRVREESVETDSSSYHPSPPMQRATTTTAEPSIIEIDDESTHTSPSIPAEEPTIEDGVEQISLDVVEGAPEHTAELSISQSQLPARLDNWHYGRRRIPLDQKTLLDKAGSWRPPLPGNRFPQANVPIQLLKLWHEQPVSPSWVVKTASAPNERDEHMADDNTSDDSDSSSDDSDLSDNEEPLDKQVPHNELPTQVDHSDNGHESDIPLDWPTSSPVAPQSSPPPPPKRPELPPDSSLGIDTPSSPPDSRRFSQSQYQQVAASERSQLPPDSSIGSSVQSTPMQKQNTRSSGVSQYSTGRQRQSAQNDSIVSRTQASPPISIQSQRLPDKSATTVSRIEAQRMQSAAPTIEHTSPAQVNLQHTPVNPRQASRPSTSASIVKATPLQNHAEDDIEMEMSVPRSLEHSRQVVEEPVEEIDPSITHQKQRSAHFRLRQREKWLRTNYTYSPAANSFAVIAILRKYKATYPKDKDVSLQEFTEALETVFPELKSNGPEATVGGLTKIPDQAAAPTTTVRDSPKGDVEMTDADVNTAGAAAAGNFRSVAAGQSKGIDFHPAGFKAGEVASSARASSGTTQSTPSGNLANSRHRSSPAVTGDISLLNALEDIDMVSESGEEISSVGANGAAGIAEEGGKKNVFGEFEQAMRNVRPGGAFAKRGADGGKPGHRFAHLDVMSWDV